MSNEMDPNEIVAMCFDCLSVLPDRVAMKDIFLQAGDTGVCPYCAGPVNPVPYGIVDSLRERRNRGEMINPGGA